MGFIVMNVQYLFYALLMSPNIKILWYEESFQWFLFTICE